jgi:hypothetical protein
MVIEQPADTPEQQEHLLVNFITHLIETTQTETVKTKY